MNIKNLHPIILLPRKMCKNSVLFECLFYQANAMLDELLLFYFYNIGPCNDPCTHSKVGLTEHKCCEYKLYLIVICAFYNY